jgi:S-adenosylmethionine synthetase
LKDEVENITVAEVVIDEEEDITVTFNRDAEVAEVYQAANELVEALKGELEEAKLTLNGEREFDLSDEGVAAQIALYLLDGTDPEEFLKGKEAVEAIYTVEATDQDGITFTLAGDLVFKVAEPSQDEIDAAKAAFLGYLGAEVEKITVADVEIEEEDITVTFNRDAKVAEVYQAANELVEALKGELEEAKLTLNGEREFDLSDEGVAVQIALYLLDGTDPEEFLKGKEAVEAIYTVEATDQDGITFTLAGDLVFKVAEPSQDEIDAAKAAFLGYLGAEVEKITVADVEIEEEDITVTFNRDAKVAEVYQAANELVEALKGELEEAKLTLNGEREFDLSDEGVAVQIALYLLDGTDPEEFLKGKEAVEAIYTVEATDQDGITFTLAGDLVFKVAEPSQDEIDAAKAAFLGYLGAEVEKITVADVEIEEEDITVTFNRDAKVAEVYQAANELVEALKGELEEAKLTLNGEREFDLSDEGVAVQIALYLLDGTDPEEFLKGKEAVEAIYTVEATDQDGITFTLAGDLVFKVAEPSQDEIDAAKAAFLGYLGAEVEKITVADVEIEEEDITVTFNRDAKVAEVYQAANELVEALKGELEAAKLTLNGEKRV